MKKQIDELASLLEEPRAVRLLAEWLAIDHDETRLQFEKYMESAQELYEYITIIIKLRKPGKLLNDEGIDNIIKQARSNPNTPVGWYRGRIKALFNKAQLDQRGE